MSPFFKNIVASMRSTLKPYGAKFQNRYPRTYRLYITLKKGSSQFTKETFYFFKIKFRMIKNSNYVETMSLNDVLIYRQVLFKN